MEVVAFWPTPRHSGVGIVHVDVCGSPPVAVFFFWLSLFTPVHGPLVMRLASLLRSCKLHRRGDLFALRNFSKAVLALVAYGVWRLVTESDRQTLPKQNPAVPHRLRIAVYSVWVPLLCCSVLLYL